MNHGHHRHLSRLLACLLFATLCGCSTLVAIDLKDSSGVNVGSISLQDSSWPVVSYFTGPTYRFRIYNGFDGSIWLEGNATLTNSTNAAGIYESSEAKNLEVRMGFSTNLVGKAKSPAIDGP